MSKNLYVHPSRGRRDRPARRTTDQSSEPASGLGPDALTSNWIAVKQLTGRVGGGTKDVGGVTVGGEGGLRGGGGTGSLRKERKGWTGGLGSADGRRRTDEVRGKGDTRLRSFPRVSIRGTLSNQRPPRIARPARTRRERGFKSFGVSTTRIGRSRHRGGPGRGDTHGEDGQGSATGSLVSGGQGHHGGTLRGDGGDRASAESLGLAREGGARHDGGRSGGNGSHFDLRGVQRLA